MLKNNLIKSIFLPLLLSIIFLVLQSVFLFKEFGILSVVEDVDLKFESNNQKTISMLRDQTVSGKFRASTDNMGIIFIPAIKIGKGEDELVFRIREIQKKNWLHEIGFSATQAGDESLFPLGFPVINNSKNRTYFLEIKSLSGNYENGISVITNKKLKAMYQYAQADLKNPINALTFVYKKIVYIFKNFSYLNAGIIFFLSYFVLLIFNKHHVITKNSEKLTYGLRRTLGGYFKIIKNLFLVNKRKVFFYLNHHRLAISNSDVYVYLFKSQIKKRIIVGLFLFSLAFLYRFSSFLEHSDNLFYAGLGGGGDYDQFIRASTCAVESFCTRVIHQNLLVGSIILGFFYKLFGFISGIKAYVYLMIIVSSIVSTLPYILLSRTNWVNVAGIIGSLFLATSDFLTNVSLNFPPDNGSTFIFSMLFLVYLLTINFGTIRWLIVLGLIGFVDGMFKALFLINDLILFVLFFPVFFYERTKILGKKAFRKKNIKILFLSLIPLAIFLSLYSAWEYFVFIKFSAAYFLRGLLLTGGESYVSYTSFGANSFAGNILSQFFYLLISAIVMVRRLIEYSGLEIIFLAPIFAGLFYYSFMNLLPKTKFPKFKFLAFVALSAVHVGLLFLIDINFFNIHKIFEGEYIVDNWTMQVYIEVSLLSSIVMLFIINLNYKFLKLSLPIIPYVIMLVILTKNSPFPRISTQVVVWMIILLSFILNWILTNKNSRMLSKANNIVAIVILVLFVSYYIYPKVSHSFSNLNSGLQYVSSESDYLSWVDESIPSENSMILTSGGNDLILLGQSIDKAFANSTIWSMALLIEPNKIPGIERKDFSVVDELSNKKNFEKKRYFILEDDIELWRKRLKDLEDAVFTKDVDSVTSLHGSNYSIKVFKSNSFFQKNIYELKYKEKTN